MKAEKKFFALNDVTYTIVTGKRWYVEYYIQHPTGVRERKRSYGQINREKDLEKREYRAVQLIREISGGNSLSKESVLLKTLKENAVLYRTKTFQTYTSRIKFFTDWLQLTDKSETALSLDDANNFIKYSLERKSNGTVRGYRRTLCSLYNRISPKLNPFTNSYQPPKTYKSLMFYSDEQIAALSKYLKVAMPDVWMAIQLLFYCFIRPGEIRLLKVNDINIDYGFIEIRSEISKNKKTQKVSIPSVFKPMLKQYVKGKTGYLFQKNGKPLAKNFLNRKHSEALKACNIIGRYAFYSWKHTGAVKAVKYGINLKDLQLQLRHHSLDMVNEYLKNLGVLDSQDLKTKFPSIIPPKAHTLKMTSHPCSCKLKKEWNFCPECGMCLKEAV